MATNIEAMTAGTVTKSLPNSKQFQATVDVITAKVVLTEASIAAQVASSATFTVPGVALGDFVFISYPASVLGLILVAAVSATDTIRVTAFNVEGTDAVTVMSGGLTANILVLKPKTGWAQN
jgi:hypothetical protein